MCQNMLHLWLHREAKLSLWFLLQFAFNSAQMWASNRTVSLSWDLWPSSLHSSLVCDLSNFQDVNLVQDFFDTCYYIHLTSSCTTCSVLKTFLCSLHYLCSHRFAYQRLIAPQQRTRFAMYIFNFGFFFLVTWRLQINYIMLYNSYW